MARIVLGVALATQMAAVLTFRRAEAARGLELRGVHQPLRTA